MKVKLLTAAVLFAGTLTAGVGGVWFANAQEKGKLPPGSGPAVGNDKPPPAASTPNAPPPRPAAAKDKKVLTPDQIVQGKIEGAVRVEFTVESLYWETGASTEKTIPMNFKLRGEKTDGDLFQVQVAGRVFTRLSELGIENTPKENSTEGTPAVYRHFEGKTVRVNGVVKRLPLAQRDGFLYWLRIDNLDQIESVSKK